MVLSLLCTFVAHITFLHVFFLPPPFILSLSLAFSFSLSLFLSLSLYLCPLFLSVVARHMSSDALYQIFSSWSILLFHTISFHSSYKIHQLFTHYLLRLPSSELLEKHLFRSRANRRLVAFYLAFYLAYLLTFYLAYLLALYLAYLMAFYLAYLLAFYLTFYLAYLLAFYLAFEVQRCALSSEVGEELGQELARQQWTWKRRQRW